jgi:prepilin-type N-terminal cleavage/methylation domain-containing protein
MSVLTALVPTRRGSVRSRPAGFTLVELMATISVILILLTFAAPSLSGVLKGKKQDQAVAALEAVLEGARMEAVTQNIHVWVAFKNVSLSDNIPGSTGEDEIWVMAFRGRNGEESLNTVLSVGLVPVGNFRRLMGVNLLGIATLPDPLKMRLAELSNQTAQSGDVMEMIPMGIRVSWAGTTETGAVNFDRALHFTPRGEVMWEAGGEGVPLQTKPYFSFGLGRTLRGVPMPVDKDMVAVLVGGLTGRVSVVRP